MTPPFTSGNLLLVTQAFVMGIHHLQITKYLANLNCHIQFMVVFILVGLLVPGSDLLVCWYLIVSCSLLLLLILLMMTMRQGRRRRRLTIYL